MRSNITNVLFVSKANGCRSLLAEACLNQLGQGKLKAFSCGHPTQLASQPDSWTLLTLQTAGIEASGLKCKAWTDFTKSTGPKMNFVIGLDAQVFAQHPAWPGQPVTALWEYPEVQDDSMRAIEVGIAAMKTLISLRRRIELLVSLHARGEKHSALQQDLREMAHL